jgi:hypothetical protein
MGKSEVFKDYNFEGSNIAMLIELFSYVGDLSTYYTNLLAKNSYEDTTDIFEVLHRIVKTKGYQPKGYVSGQTTLSISVSGLPVGNQLYIEPWQYIDTGLETDDGQPIIYSYVPNTESEALTTVDINGNASFEIELREGAIVDLEYYGDELVDNQILLPLFKYDYGIYPFTMESIQVSIKNSLTGDTEYTGWQRVSDFYEGLSGVTTTEGNNVFQFNYDKYKQYVIDFSTSRNVPSLQSIIRVKVLKSNGVNGIIDKGVITSLEGINISNLTLNSVVDVVNIHTVTNTNVASQASNPETLDDLRNNSKAIIQSQLRNITKNDYKVNLEERTDVVVAYAWGEQDINAGQPILFNKVYFSTIPPLSGDGISFQLGTLETSAHAWGLSTVTSPITADIQVPVSYDSDYNTGIIRYLEQRKAINVLETLIIPNFVYFMFEIGIKIKRNYNFTNVRTDLLNKLEYYFSLEFRKFGETIDFFDITEFLIDPANTSSTDDFTNTRGIRNLLFRDLNIYTTPVSGNSETIYDLSIPSTQQFPHYEKSYIDDGGSGYLYDNSIRRIVLRYDQFPRLSINHCVVINEG